MRLWSWLPRWGKSVPPLGPAAAVPPPTWSSRFKWFGRRAIRVTQITAIGLTLYQCGYAKGLTDFAEDPETMHKELMKSAIKGGGDKNAVLHVHGSEALDRVNRIGAQILSAALTHAEEKLAEARVAKAALHAHKGPHQHVPHYLDPPHPSHAATELRLFRFGGGPGDVEEEPPTFAETEGQAESVVELWEAAVKLLSAKKWYFLVTTSRVPNAYVSPLCPRRVFVNEGILRCTDDELALIVSHELSHSLLAHGKGKVSYDVGLAFVGLVSLSLVDPFVSFLSLGLDFGFMAATSAAKASHSRECESEADYLGVQLATRAGFDVVCGSKFLQKLADGDDNETAPSAWLDTHPSTAERHPLLRDSALFFNTVYGPSSSSSSIRGAGQSRKGRSAQLGSIPAGNDFLPSYSGLLAAALLSSAVVVAAVRRTQR